MVRDHSDYLGGGVGGNYLDDPDVYAQVLWVLALSYPALSLDALGAAAGVTDLARNDAIEATQFAIWRYSDLGFDAPWAWSTTDSEAVYTYLVNTVNALPLGTSPADLRATVSVSAPSSPGPAGTLVGPFVVSTNQPVVRVEVDPLHILTDAAGTAIDPDAVVDGQELYLDLRSVASAGSATIRASVPGGSMSGSLVNVPLNPGDTPTVGAHAQTIMLIAPATVRTAASAAVSWGTAGTTAGSAELAATGAGESVLQAAGIALVLLVPGVLLLLARRRVRA